MRKLLSNKEIISRINKISKKCKHPFICSNPLVGYNERGLRKIEVKSLINNQTKVLFYSNIYENSTPFEVYNKISDEELQKRVNIQGQKTKGPKYSFVKTFIVKDKNGKSKRKIVVKSEFGEVKTINYENFVACKNTFSKNGDQNRHDRSFIENKVEIINKKSPSHLQIKLLDTYCKNGDRFVIIQNTTSKEIRNIEWGSIRKGSNPFRTFSEEFIKKEVNELGQKTKGFKFEFVKIVNRAQALKLMIKNKYSGNKLIVTMKALRKGYNPFSPTQGQRIEVNEIHPLYEKLFRKHNVQYVKEFNLGKKRIDFMFYIKNKKYGLEIKRSDQPHYSEKQIKVYNQLGSLKQFNLSKIFLSDPKGVLSKKGGVSLSQFEAKLIDLK